MFFWQSEVLPGVRAAFTDVSAGNLALHLNDDVGEVSARRAKLERLMGVQAGSLRFMNQTHSAVAVDVQASPGVPDADALVSLDGSSPLAVMVADCVPVVLAGIHADGRPGPTAVAHAGRRGILDGIIDNTVGLLQSRAVQRVSAWIGPSICGDCYEVPQDMRNDVAGRIPEGWSTTRWDTAGLDLPSAVRAQLTRRGVSVEPVTTDQQLCTFENASLYSHRASAGGRPPGRLVGLVWRA